MECACFSVDNDDKRRSLACVITDKWIPACWPETIIMENVEEFKSWGPVDHCGRVMPAGYWRRCPECWAKVRRGLDMPLEEYGTAASNGRRR